MKKFSINPAFTLAEVMITLGIIGVVAAIIMPTFIRDTYERIHSQRQANIAQKITKAVELMIVNGEYQDIYTTEQFVDKLSKYLKIAKRCNSEHLTECWPTSKIKTTTGEQYNVENAKTAADLHVGKTNTTPNVGLILVDGASLIMTFNPNKAPVPAEVGFTYSSKNLPVGKGKTQNFAYTSNATEAIDFVMDVNGATGPNQEYNTEKNEYYDIRSFKTAIFDGCAGARIPELGCVIKLETNKSWNSADKACSDIGMKWLSTTDLRKVYDERNNYSYIPRSGNYWSSGFNGINQGRYIDFANGSEGWLRTDNSLGLICLDEK